MEEKNYLSLCDCKIGIEYKIQELSMTLSQKNKMRLLEFGFIKGKKIKLLKKSLLKKTLLVELMGFILSLRADIAESVVVKR